jgi:PKD repeat protein
MRDARACRRPLALCGVALALLLGAAGLAESQEPVLFFSDLTSGPSAGNGDGGAGRVPGRDGVFVTVWGRNLGAPQASRRVSCGGADAAVIAFGDASAPANLFASHGAQKLVFQVSHLARPGDGEIVVTVDGRASNSIPFTVREGRILFLRGNGSDETGDGSFSKPWKSFRKAVSSVAPGDVVYVGDGVDQTTATDFDAAVVLGASGEPGRPKALVVAPGSVSRVGSATTPRAFYAYDGERDAPSAHWVLSGFTVTTAEIGLQAHSGSRIVGNFVTAPQGDGLDGAIGVWGSAVAVLGNELTNVGGTSSGKLYHALYLNGTRRDDPPRAPTESDREVGWNYFHGNACNRAVDVYSEQPQSAFLARHRIHDNVILDQHGDGILLGYYVTGENWIVNNLVVRAGLGPDWPDDTSSHAGIRVDAGHESSPGTVVHVLHNTVHGCGWPGSPFAEESGLLLVSPEALQRATVDVRNNVFSSTGSDYVATASGHLPATLGRNLWSGAGTPPAWDTGALAAPPGFLDGASGDFHLGPESAALDAAVTSSPPVERDLDGVPRPQGSASDVGAYERRADSGGACSISCSANVPGLGVAGESLAFSLAVTTAGCAGATPTVSWSFGDGGTASGASALHVYLAPGTYSWSATASTGGASCSGSGTVLVAASPVGHTTVLAAVTHAPGAEQALFRTDVAAVNLGSTPATLALTFAPADGASPLVRAATLPALGTAEWQDVLVSLFGYPGSASVYGSLVVASDVPVLVSSRTFNEAPSGSFGAYLPGVKAAQALSPGTTGLLLHLKKSVVYRTNVGVVNLGTESVSVLLQLRGPSGEAVGSARRVIVPGGRLVQETDVFTTSGAGARQIAYAVVEVETPGGRAWAFASVIDGRTNDPTIVPLVLP